MNNFQKTVYGLIIVLFSSIIIGSYVYLPDYKDVQIQDLELTTDTVQAEYKLGQMITFNAYLRNNHPYKVQVTLPDNLTFYQVPLNHRGSIVVGWREVEDKNQAIIIEPYNEHYLTTLIYGPQRRVGCFELHIGYQGLDETIVVNITSDESKARYYTEGLDIWVPSSFLVVNYTGLPEDEDIRIYPEHSIIYGDSFRIVFENNRNQSLYWGADWRAEKWINGEWIVPNEPIFYTLDLRHVEPFSLVVDSFRFHFDEGLYRISKRCMLSDNYDREKREWVNEFTASFYIIKTQ